MTLPLPDTAPAMAAASNLRHPEDFAEWPESGAGIDHAYATLLAALESAIRETAERHALAVLEPLTVLCAGWTCLARDGVDALPVEMCLIHQAIAEIKARLRAGTCARFALGDRGVVILGHCSGTSFSMEHASVLVLGSG